MGIACVVVNIAKSTCYPIVYIRELTSVGVSNMLLSMVNLTMLQIYTSLLNGTVIVMMMYRNNTENTL